MDEVPVLRKVHEHPEIRKRITDEVLEPTRPTLDCYPLEIVPDEHFEVETSTDVTSSL